jgi:PAS domain S-box-containing protein
LSRADGSFAGIVCAVVSLERFVTKFSALDVGTHGLVTLRDGDLALIVRSPKSEGNANSLGSLRPSRELERLVRQNPKEGLYVARAKSDDVERIFSFRKLSDYNLYIVVGLAPADSFDDWRSEAVAMLCLAFIFAAMTLLAGGFLSRSWKARELALQEAEVATAQLGAILQNSPIGLAIIGIDRVIQLANKALGDIFGIPAERFRGRSSEVMLGSRVQFDELGRRAYPIILSGGTFEDEVSMHRQDGGVFWCKMRGRLLDPSVPSRGVVWVMEDSTEHKRNDQQLTLYRSLIEYTSDCVYVISPRQDFRMVFANDAACAHFGVSRDELLTWRLPDWDIGLKDPDALDAFWDQVKREKSVLWQTRHRVHSNAVVPVEMSANYLQHEGESFIAGYFHNIVARMTSERALVEKTQELARSNTDLEQFAYVASHDLREPLRMVGAYLALIERRLSDHLTGETREFIDFAKDGAERMDRLILDLLDYSRIGRVKRPFAPVALVEVMSEAAANLKATIDELGGNLEISTFLPTIAGDRQELVRLFQNLIGNAIKYHAADRPPKVKVGAHQRQGEWVITVADNGIGIASPHFERIFGIFQRLHARDDYEGTGIGLAICKKIVEHHKGTIWVRSTPGEGSEFFVSFPGAAYNESH